MTTRERRLVSIIHKVCFDCGEFNAPESLTRAMETMPLVLRTYEEEGEFFPREEPDPSTPQGAAYYAWLNTENQRCTEAYASGKDFEPAAFEGVKS